MSEEIKPVRHFVSTVYIVRDGKVLLVWNKSVGSFIPIGGHVEENELPCDSVVREAKEESGFDIELIGDPEVGKESISKTGAKRVSIPQNFLIGLDVIKPNHHHINLSYVGKISGGEELENSDEGDALKWFSLDELMSSEEIFENIKKEAQEAIRLVNKYLEDKK